MRADGFANVKLTHIDVMPYPLDLMSRHMLSCIHQCVPKIYQILFHLALYVTSWGVGHFAMA